MSSRDGKIIRRATRKRRLFFEEYRGEVLILTKLGSPYGLLLSEILGIIDRHMNMYHSSQENKERIMRKLEIPEVSYHRQLKWLVDNQVLVRRGRGSYGLNRNFINYE